MKRSASRHAAASSLSLLAAVLALAASCADSTAAGACPEGQTACGGRCVDLQASDDHCGACGHACPDGSACAQGTCATSCGPGAVSCDGLCVDPLTDMAHCGACGVACAEGGACVDGVCLAACPPERTLCGGACVDTQASDAHCGACDAPCDPGDACVAGACQACPPGLEECAGACVDTQTDSQHCGGCDQECSGGQICDAGACFCPTGACGVCSATDLGSIVPQTVDGDLSGALDRYTPSCGWSVGLPDVAYTFTAPADGAYAFSTADSSCNVVLAVMDAGCAELACNDDYASGWESKVTVDLVQGQSVFVIVDAPLDTCSFTLRVAQE